MHFWLILGFFFFSKIYCNSTIPLGSEQVSITDEKVFKFWKENLSRLKECVLNKACYLNTDQILPDDAKNFKLTKAWRYHPLIGNHGYYFHFQVTFVVKNYALIKPRLLETFIYDDSKKPLTVKNVKEDVTSSSKTNSLFKKQFKLLPLLNFRVNKL